MCPCAFKLSRFPFLVGPVCQRELRSIDLTARAVEIVERFSVRPHSSYQEVVTHPTADDTPALASKAVSFVSPAKTAVIT